MPFAAHSSGGSAFLQAHTEIASAPDARSANSSHMKNRLFAFLVLAPRLLHAQGVDWPAYGRDAAGSKYSPAAAITRDNVAKLTVAWSYRTGDYARGDATGRDETTPLFVDGVLYASTLFGGVRALDPSSGKEVWSYDSELDLSGDYGDFTNRGVSTWLDATRAAGAPCHRRIYVAPVDARLIALDARTGAPCADFGAHGTIDLRRDVANIGDRKGEYSVTSPPAIINGLVVIGSTVADNRRAVAPGGVVRAYDARTGALRWSWNPVPAGETGAANAWSIISADSARDLVFVPTGSASPDFFGGQRPGTNLYANSVVALRASTGKLVWSFQVVHHDLWDYDVPAEPVLFTMHRDGRDIPALLQTTKMGFVFVLDRDTGKPLFPVEERPVPASDIPGEHAWPTQPFPVVPAPLGPTRLDLSDIFAVSDSGRAWCEAQLKGVRSGGIFTPPSLQGTVIFPGNIGGSNWSGVAVDPAHHLAIIPSNRIATVVDLIPRADLHGRAMGGTRFDEFAPQAGTPYGLRRRHMIGPDGVPCNRPPWGVLTAIDLETGATKWERPLGAIPALANRPGSEKWGSPNLGGAMITAGGLIFAGGAVDQRLHAFDVETGTEVWSAQLPAGVHGSPMTFVTRDGEEYVVVAAGGHKELRDKVGDYIVAFALPRARHAADAKRITAGEYDGHIIFDRSRFPVRFTIHTSGHVAEIQFETTNPRVIAQGKGRVIGDSLTVDVNWNFPAQNCSGTAVLRGTTANEGSAIVGELDYMDGCGDHTTKPGTFSLKRR
jgi:quinoprotein glucose dehydrogenase